MLAVACDGNATVADTEIDRHVMRLHLSVGIDP